MAIGIGSAAIDRSGVSWDGYTRIDLANPANAAGTIDTVQIYCAALMNGVVVGTFFLVSGTTYECRDSAAIGEVTPGLKTFDGLSIGVEAGDFIGIYWTSGTLETDSSGGTGRLHASGEHIDPSDQASYSSTDSGAQSVYSTGTESGPTPNAFNKILYTSEPPTPNAWNQVKQEAGTGWKKLLYV